jgi:hypothetical protein
MARMIELAHPAGHRPHLFTPLGSKKEGLMIEKSREIFRQDVIDPPDGAEGNGTV